MGQEDPLGKKMAAHFSILAWEIPWTEGAWQATVHGIAKQSDTTLQLNDDNGLHSETPLKLKVILALLPLPCSEHLLFVLPLPPHCPQHLSLTVSEFSPLSKNILGTDIYFRRGHFGLSVEKRA